MTKIDKKYFLDGIHISDEISKINSILADLMRKDQSILDFINDLLTIPGLLGFAFADITNMIKNAKKFEYIQTNVKDIDKFKDRIHNFEKVLIRIKGGNNLFLSKVENFIEKYFSKLEYVRQFHYYCNYSDPEWKVEFLLVK